MVPPFRRFLQQVEGIMKRHEKIPAGDRMEQEAEKLPFFATHTGNVVDRVLKLSLPKMEAFESRNEVGNLD